MRLLAKLNVWLLSVFFACLVVQAWLLYGVLVSIARSHTLEDARIMIGTADAVRAYTASDLKSLLPLEKNGEFVPQSVPAHAAEWSLHRLQKTMPNYSYREPTLNPTNPEHRASDWEADIIEDFQDNMTKEETVAERDTPLGRMLVLAKPIVVRDEACLGCHGSASAAPGPLVKSYGPANGFGWKLGQVIGAQVVTVPMTVPLAEAWSAFLQFLFGALAIAGVLAALLNVLLNRLVVGPARRMTKIADAVSLGDESVEEYVKPGKDEMSALSVAFNRLRRSLKLAMELAPVYEPQRADTAARRTTDADR